MRREIDVVPVVHCVLEPSLSPHLDSTEDRYSTRNHLRTGKLAASHRNARGRGGETPFALVIYIGPH